MKKIQILGTGCAKCEKLAANAKQASAKIEFYGPQLDAYRRSVAQLTGLPAERIATTLAFVAISLNASV